MSIKDKVKKLKEKYELDLKKLQTKCKHEWIEDGTDVEGWWEVKCFKCKVCKITKTER